MSDSYLDNVLDSLSVPGANFDNLSGLGDFHLQSAVKVVSSRLIEAEKGRYREVESIRSYRMVYDEDDIRAEESSKLLILIMRLCKNNTLLNYNSEGMFDHIKVLSQSSDMIQARFLLEREILPGIASQIGGENELWNLLKGSNCYTRGRVLFSTIVVLMNAIGSGREICNRLIERLKIKHLRRVEDKKITLGNLYCVELSRNLYLFITGELVFLRVGLEKRSNTVGCWDINTIRMISDKCTERDIILRTSNIGERLYPEIYPQSTIIEKVLEIGDDCIAKHGNVGYKFIKCYESLCVGYLLTKSNDILIDNREFLFSTINDLLEEYPQFGEYTERLLELMNGCESLHHISQLYGLYRLWGHPNIDSVEGLKKVKRIGCTPKVINGYLSELAGYHFLEMFFVGYMRKNSKYPEFKLLDDSIDQSKYLIRRLLDTMPIDTTHELYDVSDWKHIELLGTFSVPETFNLAMIVDDKAISPNKQFLRDVATKKAKFMNPYERRGVLKFLSQETQGCEQFLRDVNDYGLPDDDCVIGLYPKERELNNVPRMFSLMSAEMRKYIVMTEHMLADDILPFFPQITMTADLLSLTKMIYSATKIQERSGSLISGEDSTILNLDKQLRNQFKYISVCINMDFEKWNLNMRRDATFGVFTQLGRCYGMENLFNVTYDIFYRSYIYVADENYKIFSDPNSPDGLATDGVNSYRGHIGGFEGLRQKGWTIFTVVVIKMICEKHKIQYKLMGQGDNQVLVLKLYTNQLDSAGNFTEEGVEELKSKLSNIMGDLEMTFGDLGLPLKTLESWKSESLFLYGKYPVFKGVPLSMSLKKICRCFPFSNDDNMTIDNVLGSIFTNAQAASMSELSLTIPYIVGLQEGYIGVESMMQYHPLLGQSIAKVLSVGKTWELFNPAKHGVEKFRIELIPSLRRVVAAILLFPKSLSGSNGITLLEFTMRGFPDNHSRDMSYLDHIRNSPLTKEDQEALGVEVWSFAVFMQETAKNIMRLCFVDNLSPDFLVEDPCALNLLNPITPISVLRKKVKEAISQSGMIKNRDFKDLFDLASDARKGDLCNALISRDSLFPRLLHDLYGATLFGYVDGIVSKVDKTSTVQKISLQGSPVDIMKLVMATETNFLKFLIWRMSYYRAENLPGEPTMPSCPTNYIRWGRYYGWGKQVLGVTVPFPSHLFYHGTCVVPMSDCPDGSYVSAYISQNTPAVRHQRMTSIGRSPPYLGSYTKEKVKTYEKVAIYGSEPLLKRVVKALKVVGWAIGEESNVHKFLREVLSSISDLDSELFLSDSDQVSGSMGHRYHDAALKHGALLPSMYTMGTWCHISTDTLVDYSKGSKNVTLHFQALLCWVQIVLNSILTEDSPEKMLSSYHFHVTCKECIVPVEDEIPDIDNIPTNLIPANKDNPYCFVRHVDVIKRDRSSYSSLHKLVTATRLSLEDIDNREKFFLIHEYYAERICADVMSGASDGRRDTHVSSGLMDVGEYPRIAFLKLNPLFLFSSVCFKIEVEILRRKANSDDEVSWSLQGLHSEMMSSLASCPPSGYLGLGTFYSWPNKIKEILSIPYTSSPRSFPFNIDQANLAAKESLIQFARHTYSLTSHREGAIINFTEGVNIVNNFLGKVILDYLKKLKTKDKKACQHCMRAIFKNFISIIISNNEGVSHRCPLGHYMPGFKETVLQFMFVSFSIDAIEKSYVLRSPPKIPFSSFNRAGEHMVNSKERALDMSIELFDSRKERVSPIVSANFCRPRNAIREYADVQMSRLFRLIPYEESTCYRVFELLRSSIFIGTKIHDICLLGDGIGGSSVTVAEYYQAPKLSMTLSSCDQAYPQTYPHAVPPSILMNGMDELINYKESTSYKMDITIPTCRLFLMRTLMKLGCKSLISEIEFEHIDGNYKAYKNMPKYIYELMLIEKAVIKIRIGPEGELSDIRDLLSCSSNYWERFKIIVTPFCSVEKREFWLLLDGRIAAREEMPGGGYIEGADTLYFNQSLRVMQRHFETNLYRDIEEEYFNRLNDEIMTVSRTEHSIRLVENYVQRTFPKFKLGKTISWSSFLYNSVFNKVPKFVWNMGSKVGKYRYENEERELWQTMLMILCASSKSVVSMKCVLDRLDMWRVYLVSNEIFDPLSIDNFKIGIIISAKRLRFSDDIRFKEIVLSGDRFKSKFLRYTPLIMHLYPTISERRGRRAQETDQIEGLIGADVIVFGRQNMLDPEDTTGFTREGKATYLSEELRRNRISSRRVKILPITKTLSRKLRY
ncbi:TPA_asm: L [Populus betacytorhabdovirus 1]|nr:TPA_asm: L [Populus betacytorhabdovirus 1]